MNPTDDQKLVFPNYTLQKTKVIPEFNLTGYLLEHNLTKARIFYAACPTDDNMVFSINFKTLPENDCGIPHILEHCVLNGSEKFPVKEPFVELLKGSLNTFLNAMTFPDKTMFPVASRNEKDFENLMDVYLDAVFHPNLRKDPFIFRQEGWHYELDRIDEPIRYKGVVYNEMKGAYSDPERILEKIVNRAMYPDSVYSYSSGGDPEAIPELTYEQFRDFHTKYYHPENSYIFFYGNGDMKRHLSFLDENYLSHFEPASGKNIASISLQERFEKPVFADGVYGINEEDDPAEKGLFDYSVMLDPLQDLITYHGTSLLCEILGCEEASPLKQALIKSGICKSVSVTPDFSMLQPAIHIIATGADPAKKDDFVRIVKETMETAVRDGFDKDLVEAAVNSNEFILRERNNGSVPNGLMIAVSCMDSWLYGNDPWMLLPYEEAFATMRAKERFFEDLLQRLILDNTHTVISVLSAEKGYNQKIEEAEKNKLKEYKESLSEEELETLVKETEEIKAYQQRPDDPQDLEKIPLLSRSDLTIPKPFEPAHLEEAGGIPVSVYVDEEANHITYLGVYFTMDHIPERLIPIAALLPEVLAMMDTEKHTYQQIDNEIGKKLGSLDFGIRCIRREDRSFTPYFYLSSRFLTSKSKEAFSLMKEILLHTSFEDTTRLKEIISDVLISLQQNISFSGHMTSLARCRSYFDEIAAYKEVVAGIDYFLMLKDLEANFDEKKDAVIADIKEVFDRLILKENLKLRITTMPSEKDQIKTDALEMIDEVPSAHEDAKKELLEGIVRIKPVKKNEALITSGKVQYVARAGLFEEEYNGSMLVLGQILSLDYLWNRVRVQGGAYGCGKSILRIGEASMVSYRDPNLKETIDIFNEAGEILSNFTCDERELTKYIIGAMATLDPVRTLSMRGKEAHERLEAGTPMNLAEHYAKDILSTDIEKIQKCARILSEAMQSPYLCVQGTESKIKENEALFDRMIYLF